MKYEDLNLEVFRFIRENTTKVTALELGLDRRCGFFYIGKDFIGIYNFMEEIVTRLTPLSDVKKSSIDRYGEFVFYHSEGEEEVGKIISLLKKEPK